VKSERLNLEEPLDEPDLGDNGWNGQGKGKGKVGANSRASARKPNAADFGDDFKDDEDESSTAVSKFGLNTTGELNDGLDEI
jgi:hypothetical protein